MNNMKVLRTVFLAVAVAGVMSTAGRAAEFFLRADVTTKTMPDGQVIPMWGFALDTAFGANDGTVTVPGPLLSVPPGDTTLTIHLKNNLTPARTGLPHGCPVSLVIPGQVTTMTPVRFGPAPYPQFEGRVRSLTHETEPNNTTPVDYVWTHFKPGTYVYHSGTHIQCHVQMGLYGGITKDYAATPYKQVYPGVVYETSVPLFFSEIDPAFHLAVDANDYGPGKAMTSTIDYEAKYFLINGEPFVPGQPLLTAGAHGGGTLLRLFNMGLETRCPLLQGSYMTLIAEDGQPYRYPKEQYVASLPAGKTIDAMVVFPSAGTYPLYDRRLGLTNAKASEGGMLKRLDVANGSFWPVLNSVTATPAAIRDTETSQLLATAGDQDTPGPDLTYTWEVPPGVGTLDNVHAPNPIFTPAFTATTQTHTLQVVVSDGSHVDLGTVAVTVKPTPTTVIVDNRDAGVSWTGTWSHSSAAGFWATNSVYSNTAGSTFTFPADLLPDATYAVYAWWTAASNRSTAVPYQIRSGASLLGTATVNQRLNGGQWNLLGVYSFSQLASVTVVQAGGITVADAVQFVPVTLDSLEITGPVTVNENATADYDAIAHYSGGISVPVQPQAWTVDMPEAAINATGLLTAGAVGADMPVMIRAEYTANGVTVADTQGITILNSPLPPEVIVDNLSAGTSSVGTWNPSLTGGFYGTNSVYSNTAGSSFTFPATLVPGTTYQVYAWWTAATNRYTAVPYEIRSGAALLGTVAVNQRNDGGQWNLLGTYAFSDAAASVTVVRTGTGVTSADAVRFVPVP